MRPTGDTSAQSGLKTGAEVVLRKKKTRARVEHAAARACRSVNTPLCTLKIERTTRGTMERSSWAPQRTTCRVPAWKTIRVGSAVDLPAQSLKPS